jgi:hypothetical protein
MITGQRMVDVFANELSGAVTAVPAGRLAGMARSGRSEMASSHKQVTGYRKKFASYLMRV